MNRSAVRNLVTAKLSSHLNFPEHQITEEHGFYDDLGADSLDVVELTLIFEEMFKVEITDDELEQSTTVGAVINLLHKKVSENMIEEQDAQQPEVEQTPPEDEPEVAEDDTQHEDGEADPDEPEEE